MTTYDKKDLVKLQEKMDELSGLKDTLKLKRDAFDEENKALLLEISLLDVDILKMQDVIREQAKAEYLITDNKKLLGGIGIRVISSLIYDKTDALKWAKEHSLCLSLDKRAFDKIAKSQDLDFVTKKEETTVTFPPKIKLEDDK